MQATENRLGDDLAPGLLLFRLLWWTRDMLVDALVWSGMVEIGLILLHGPIELLLVQDEEEVEAFTPHTAQKTLANSVGLGGLIRCGQDFDAGPFGDPVEGVAELVVVVANQEAWPLAKGSSFSQLLGDPAIMGCPGRKTSSATQGSQGGDHGGPKGFLGARPIAGQE
jgi:hypothetical protein